MKNTSRQNQSADLGKVFQTSRAMVAVELKKLKQNSPANIADILQISRVMVASI